MNRKSSEEVAFRRHGISRQAFFSRFGEVMSHVAVGATVRGGSDRHPRPSFFARAGGLACHDPGGELRDDVYLRRGGQAECAQRAFEAVDQLTSLVLGRATVTRERGELIADALERLRDRGRELAQVAAQSCGETKRVER